MFALRLTWTQENATKSHKWYGPRLIYKPSGRHENR